MEFDFRTSFCPRSHQLPEFETQDVFFSNQKAAVKSTIKKVEVDYPASTFFLLSRRFRVLDDPKLIGESFSPSNLSCTIRRREDD